MSTPPAGAWNAQHILTVPAADARCLCLSPDGTGLVVVHGGEVVRHDDEGRAVWRLPWPGPPPAADRHPGTDAAVWTPDGDRLFLLGAGHLVLLDADTGEPVELPPELHTEGEITALALSPDARLLAAGLRSGDVLLLYRAEGTVTRLRGVDPVVEVCWIPGRQDTLCVATATSAQLWEPHGRTMTGTLGGLFEGLRRVACSPEGRAIAVEDYAGLRLLDPGSGRELRREFVPYRMNALAFGHDGSLLIAGSELDGLRVLGPHLDALGQLPGRVTGPGALSLSASGLFAALLDTDTVAVWEPSGAVPRPHRRRDPAALRRWANAMGVTVGKVHTRTGERPPGVLRAVRLPEAGLGCVAPALAWSPDGARHWCESGPGRILEYAADATRPLGGAPVPSFPHGWYDAACLAGDRPVLVLAAHYEQGVNRLVDPSDGGVLAERVAGQAVTADPVRPLRWAAPEPGPDPRQLLVHDLAQDGGGPQRLPVEDGVRRPAWSPDGRLLAAGTRGRVIVWGAATTGRCRRVRVLDWPDRQAMVCRVAWSPDGSRLAATPGSAGGPVVVWDTGTWQRGQIFGEAGGRDWAPALSWCADSRLLAFPSADQDSVAEVWDAQEARRIRVLVPPDGVGGHLWTLRWSPVGDQLAATYNSGAAVLWELFTGGPRTAAAPVPPNGQEELIRLAVLAAVHGFGVPLDLLADVLALLRGTTPPRLRTLADHRGLHALRELGWPGPALAGLALLLVADLPADPAYLAPPEVTPADLAQALGRTLTGSSIPARRSAPTLTELTAALGTVDDRLVALLRILGPEAVAADPTLPARMRRLPLSLTPPGPAQRALLGLRLLDGDTGLAMGGAGGTGRSGLARHGRADRLLPTQLALPTELLRARHAREELLYRTSSGRLPRDPHGLVLLLDDTPATHGKVGSVLRLAAHLMAATVLRLGRPCALVPLGEPWRSRILQGPEDLVHVWAAGPLTAGDAPTAFREAEVVAARLTADMSGPPRMVLLSHPYLRPAPRPGLRELRVHYPHIPLREPARHRQVLPPEPSPEELRAALTALLSDE
ncbi:WD40 repeat domain-containing protein [Streptomyces sp. NRAIS4]